MMEAEGARLVMAGAKTRVRVSSGRTEAHSALERQVPNLHPASPPRGSAATTRATNVA